MVAGVVEGLAAACLLALYRISGVPSFLVGPAGAAACLLALYRISGVPSFLVGPAAVDDLVVATAFGLEAVLGGVVWAKDIPAKASNKLTIRTILFIIRCFFVVNEKTLPLLL